MVKKDIRTDDDLLYEALFFYVQIIKMTRCINICASHDAEGRHDVSTNKEN